MEADNDVALMFMDGGRESLEFFRGYNGPLYADGTFYVTPQPFDSILIVHLEYENHTFPMFYFLLPKRTKAMYTAVFSRVAETIAPFAASISHCMTDFETALMKSCESVFQVPVKGCWFHYSQAVFKKVQKLGLLHRFRNIEGNASDFKKLIHCYMALPLLPADAIEEAMRELSTKVIPLPPAEQRQLQQFRRYVASFWIQKVTPQRLSVFGLKRRSNNSVESFNATLKRKIQKAHPNIFLFIEHLNNVITAKLSDLRNVQNGHRVSRRKPRLQLTNENKLDALELQHTQGGVTSMEFLEKACATFHRYVDNLNADDNAADEAGAGVAVDNGDVQRDDDYVADAAGAAVAADNNDERDDDYIADAAGAGVAAVPHEDNDDDEDNVVPNGPPPCPICLQNPRNAVMNPCGHSACYDCAHTIHTMQDPGNKCHECRSPILSVIRVFGMG